MKPIVFHTEAELEMHAATKFYESKVEGLGFDFLEEIKAAAATIQAAPRRWPERRFGVRRFLAHRFPFTVVYLDMPHRIWVVAVAHASRRPDYWKSRLDP